MKRILICIMMIVAITCVSNCSNKDHIGHTVFSIKPSNTYRVYCDVAEHHRDGCLTLSKCDDEGTYLCAVNVKMEVIK
jgi:hypothetical protein